MAKFLGESVSKEVIDQLARRAKFVDKTNSVLEDGYKVQQFLQSRGVWIRLISSVNELEGITEDKPVDIQQQFVYPSLNTAAQDNTRVSTNTTNTPPVNDFKEKAPINYSIKNIKSNSNLAKKYILSGGELEWNGEQFVPRQGINFGESEQRKAYNYTDTFGVRPMAGITSFSISCKNRFCSVREADISFNVWSLEDFKAVQKLYLRPGFSVILEWGDSLYIDENESIVEALQSEKQENLKKFFSDSSFVDIEEIVKDKKEAFGTSYDSFIGYVRNFNWTLRKDGGYDCSIKVISKGSVIESLTVDKSVGYTTALPAKNTPGYNSKEKSIFHYLYDYFLELTEKTEDGSIKLSNNTIINFPINEIVTDYEFVNSFLENESKTTIPVYTLKLDQSVEEDSESSSKYFFFTTLRSVLRIVNSFYLLKNQGSKSLEFRFNTLSTNKFLTFENHFSIAPLECFLPKVPTQDRLKFTPSSTNLFKEQNYSNSFHISGLSHKLDEFYKIGENDEILNVGISINKVVDILETILSKNSPPEGKNIQDFITQILTTLNENFGGINDFDIQIDEENNAYIVDRNFTAVNKYKKPEREEENIIGNIRLSGITSLIQDLNVSSNISSQIASQVAISAQSTLSPDPQTNQALLNWNTGIVDRFSPSKSSALIPESGVVPENFDEKRELFLASLGAQLGPDSNKIITSNSEWDEEDGVFTKLNKIMYTQLLGKVPVSFRIFDKKSKQTIDSIRPEFKARTKEVLYGALATSGEAPQGLIPITLRFTIDGISGFKIGQSFLIGTFEKPFPLLPDEYSTYSYIITGVEHSIENNKWFTTISGIPFKYRRMLEKIEGKNQQAGKY